MTMRTASTPRQCPCHSRDVEQEALAIAKEAIELVLESRRQRGEEIPTEIGKGQVCAVTVSVAAEAAKSSTVERGGVDVG